MATRDYTARPHGYTPCIVHDMPVMDHRSIFIALAALMVSTSSFAQSRSAKPGETVTVSVTASCIEGKTKTGEQTRRGMAAADTSVLPLGTVIRLTGLKEYNGTYTIEDTGRAIKGNDVDIFLPDCKAAKTFGRQDGRAQIERLGAGKK